MTPHTRTSGLARLPLLAMVCILFVAAAIGMRGLNSDSFWLDEIWSLYHAGGSYQGARTPLDVWNGIAAEDPWQAPLYYIALNLWGAQTGWSELATRALSLFFGLIGIAGTYRLGRDVVSPRVGVVAALFVGLSAYALYFLHELRSYSLYLLLTPFMTLAYWHLTARPARPHWYGVLGGMIIAALYTHYFAALTAVALGVFHLLAVPLGLFRGRARAWWGIAAVFVLALIAFLPWLRVLIEGITVAADQVGVRGAGALTTEDAIEGLFYLFSNGSTMLLVLLIGLALAYRPRGTLFVAFWTGCVLVLLLAINLRLGVLLEIRYMLALWPALALLAAIGVDRLSQRQPLWAIAVVALWFLSGVWVSVDPVAARALSNPHWHLPWRELHDALRPRTASGDQVVMLLPDWTWAVYHRATQDYYLHDLPVRSALMEQPGHIGYDNYQAQARAAVSETARVWVASDPGQPLTHHVDFLAMLNELGYQRCATLRDDDRLNLALYARPSQAMQTIRFGTAPFVDVSLLTTLSERASERLTVSAFFITDDPQWAAQHSVALHLASADQPIVTQADLGIPAQPRACGLVDLTLESVPPGDYTLFMTIYDWQTGARLPAGDSSGAPRVAADGRVEIGTVAVSR